VLRKKLLILALLPIAAFALMVLVVDYVDPSLAYDMRDAMVHALSLGQISVSATVPVSNNFAEAIQNNSTISVNPKIASPKDPLQVNVQILGPGQSRLANQSVELILTMDNKLIGNYSATTDRNGQAMIKFKAPSVTGTLTGQLQDRTYRDANSKERFIVLSKSINVPVLPAKSSKSPQPSPHESSAATPRPGVSAPTKLPISPQIPRQARSSSTVPAPPSQPSTINIPIVSGVARVLQTTVSSFISNLFHLF
jgi:hypothetical protein